ncbi:Chorismate dehydratase [hydrothermal vent metagenome]|uniref:Chorismate dehydratase n=1 Tax=hydrothermal vent metagenome TaxID=652676 RepID=A0A3B1DZF4_9ZZZZ
MTSSSHNPIRIGAVNYLNSKPLIEELNVFAPLAELVLDYPSHLASSLAQRQLDIALIPSVEYLRNPEYEIVSDACVATCGPVLSVKLFSRCHPREIQSLALDAGSRTSAALVQILLAERFGVVPKLEPLPLETSIENTKTDAVLLIGDRAMHSPEEKFHTVWDLGEEWTNWTGLPFVFAIWVCRTGTELGNTEQALIQSRNRGVEQIDAIAQREAPLLGISVESARCYLSNHLHFYLGSIQQRGMKLFQKLITENGLLRDTR